MSADDNATNCDSSTSTTGYEEKNYVIASESNGLQTVVDPPSPHSHNERMSHVTVGNDVIVVPHVTTDGSSPEGQPQEGACEGDMMEKGGEEEKRYFEYSMEEEGYGGALMPALPLIPRCRTFSSYQDLSNCAGTDRAV